MARGERDRFVYRGKDRTAETVIRRGQQAGQRFDSFINNEVQVLRVKEGDVCVRILPPTWKDMEKWGDGWDVAVYLHYGVGPDNSSYLCLDKMKGARCPVCEARRNSTDEEEQDALRVQERRLAWVIDRDNEKAGPQLWSMPASLFKDVCSRCIDKKTGGLIYIDDPEEGFDLLFTREGTTKERTKYRGVEIERESTPIAASEKTQDRWLDYIQDNPIPDLLVYYEPDYIEKVLFGQIEGRRKSSRAEAGEEREETDRSTRRARRGSAEETSEENDWPTESRRSVRRGSQTSDEGEEEQTERKANADEPEENPRGRRFGGASRRNGGDEEAEAEAEAEADRPRRTAYRRPRAEPEETEGGGGRLRRLRERSSARE